jgi:uncharacterized protein
LLLTKSIGNSSVRRTCRTPDGGENRKEVGEFFAAIPRADDIHAFEPREFIEADEQVTVLGWESSTARETKKTFESEWVHVFTVREGKITRWRGFFNTAARYGM